MPAFDVAVIGGGIVGSAVAYQLLALNSALSVAVIEPDSTYERASALRASGGCRVQFSRPENIEMSKYGIDFIKAFDRTMGTAKQPAHAEWVEGGYLFIVPPEAVGNLERNVHRQRAHGCHVDLLTPAELKQRFPSIRVDDLGAGAHTPHDGWCDPNGLLWGFRRKATELGARYIEDRVIGADCDAIKVRAVRLERAGEPLTADVFVNATGAWAGEVAKVFGMKLPISPLRRFEHYFTAGSPVERLPYVKDTARLAFRSEGQGFSGGVVDSDEPRGFNFDVDHGYFERVVWPALAHRFPVFEAAKCHRTWSGLYEQNELDGNPVIGPWTGLANLQTVAGFSGHGMMHAPAAGLAIAELVVRGRYETIDLTRLGYQRIVENQPYAEEGIL